MALLLSNATVSGRRGGVTHYPSSGAQIKVAGRLNVNPDGVQTTTTVMVDDAATQADPTKDWQTNDVLVLEARAGWPLVGQQKTYTVLRPTPMGSLGLTYWELVVEGAVR